MANIFGIDHETKTILQIVFISNQVLIELVL